MKNQNQNKKQQNPDAAKNILNENSIKKVFDFNDNFSDGDSAQSYINEMPSSSSLQQHVVGGQKDQELVNKMEQEIKKKLPINQCEEYSDIDLNDINDLSNFSLNKKMSYQSPLQQQAKQQNINIQKEIKVIKENQIKEKTHSMSPSSIQRDSFKKQHSLTMKMQFSKFSPEIRNQNSEKKQMSQKNDENSSSCQLNTCKSLNFADNLENLNDCSKSLKSVESIVQNSTFKEHYIKLERLGEGAHAIVYHIKDRLNMQDFAAKFYRTNDEEFIKCIEAEFKILKDITHPNIIKVHKLEEYPEQGVYVLIMEYCPNDKFFSLQHKSMFSYSQKQSIMKQLLSATSYLHANQIVHRDIQPANILVRMKKDHIILKLIDFGVSKQFKEGEQMQCFTPTGLHTFRSPDTKTGGSYNEKTDIWMIGLVLHLLMVNKIMAQKKILAKINEQLANHIKFNNLQDQLEFQLLVWMLKEDPDDRPSAEQALHHKYFEALTA